MSQSPRMLPAFTLGRETPSIDPVPATIGQGGTVPMTSLGHIKTPASLVQIVFLWNSLLWPALSSPDSQAQRTQVPLLHSVSSDASS